MNAFQIHPGLEPWHVLNLDLCLETVQGKLFYQMPPFLAICLGTAVVLGDHKHCAKLHEPNTIFKMRLATTLCLKI